MLLRIQPAYRSSFLSSRLFVRSFPGPRTRQLLFSTTTVMARKSARAIAAAEASASNQSDEDTSDLSPRSCLTCGRVITPRAKWAKDWAAIKYCSDRCKATRPGKVVAKFTHDGDLGDLSGCTGVKRDAEEVKVDLETFVESVLLDVAFSQKDDTLEDVHEKIRDLLKSALIPFDQGKERDSGSSDHERDDPKGDTHPLWKALDSPPGMRERVRRAARRLALGITHDSDPKQTNITSTDKGSIELLQGGKPLRTVEQLSFAKGVIHVRRKA